MLKLACQESLKSVQLRQMNFVSLAGGPVVLGSDNPLPCRFEGVRQNELPLRNSWIPGFWICRYCVTNFDFERFKSRHYRSRSSDGKSEPVTDLTYYEAIMYAKWLSDRTGLNFDLPTEAEWTFAAAPYGWEYPYQESGLPDQDQEHTMANSRHRAKDFYYHALPVDYPQLKPNCFGLHQMGGNVGEMTKGVYTASGQNGAQIDGHYYIAKGGAFCLCPYSARVAGRMMIDVACRHGAVGFRLVCHPENKEDDFEQDSLPKLQPVEVVS